MVGRIRQLAMVLVLFLLLVSISPSTPFPIKRRLWRRGTCESIDVSGTGPSVLVDHSPREPFRPYRGGYRSDGHIRYMHDRIPVINYNGEGNRFVSKSLTLNTPNNRYIVALDRHPIHVRDPSQSEDSEEGERNHRYKHGKLIKKKRPKNSPKAKKLVVPTKKQHNNSPRGKKGDGRRKGGGKHGKKQYRKKKDPEEDLIDRITTGFDFMELR